MHLLLLTLVNCVFCIGLTIQLLFLVVCLRTIELVMIVRHESVLVTRLPTHIAALE